MKYLPTDIARQFLYIREIPQNKGQRVEAIQKWSGGQIGDSWCCEFVTMVLDICFQGASPIPRLQACQSVYDLAKGKGWLVDNPKKDDIFLYINSVDHAHHIGFITQPTFQTAPQLGIAANTSADGISSNGDRVAEHEIKKGSYVKYIRFPR